MSRLRDIFTAQKQVFPAGIRAVILALALEWVGWGFADLILPIVAENLLNNFFLVGLLSATIQITAVMSVFLVSELLPQVGAIRILRVGKVLNVLALLSYVFAGFHGVIPLLFLGAFFHGVAVPCREASTRDYLMEEGDHNHATTIFGVNAGLRDGAWCLGMGLSGFAILLLVHLTGMSFEQLLPAAFIIAIVFVVLSSFFLWIPAPQPRQPIRFSAKQAFGFLTLIPRLTLPVKFALLLIFFLQSLTIMIALFLPLLAISLDLSLPMVGLLMAFVAAPLFLASFFSFFEDHHDRILCILFGLVLAFVPLVILSQVDAPLWIAIFAAMISLAMAIIRPACLGIIAAHTDKNDAPYIASLQVFCGRIGSFFGAVALGAVAENFGLQQAFLCLAVLAIIFALLAAGIKWHFGDQFRTKKAHWKSHLHIFHSHQ